MKRLIALMLPLAVAFSLQATVILDETFDYTAATLTDASVSSWTTTGTLTTGDGRILTNPLTYSNIGGTYILSGLGKSVRNNYASGSNYISYRSFTAVTSGVVYLSFLYKGDGDQGQTASEVIGLADQTSNSAVKPWAGKSASGSKNPFRLGVTRVSTTSGEIQWGSSDISTGEVYLLVVKYDFTAQKATLFINPVIGSATEPTASEVYDDSKGTVRTSLSKLMFKHNGSSIANFYVGGARVCTEWTEAVASYAATALEIESVVPEQNAEFLYSALTEATVTFNKAVTKGTGTIILSDGASITDISLENVTVDGAVATIPMTLLSDKSYTLTIPAGAFEAGTETSPAIVRNFTTIGSLSSTDFLINDDFDSGELESNYWDAAVSTGLFSTANLIYGGGNSMALSVANPVLQTAVMNSAGSLVFWQKHSSSTNTSLDLKISVDKGNTGTFTELVDSRIVKPTNTVFAQKKVDIDYNGPIVVRIEADGAGTTQIGLDNMTLTAYKANKVPVIEDMYTSPRFPSETDAIKFIGKITDTDIEAVEVKWGTDPGLTGGVLPLTTTGGLYESATIPALKSGDTLYYQLKITDASSILTSSVYWAPVYKAYDKIENFNTGFTTLPTSTGSIPTEPIVITNADIAYSFTGTTRNSSTKAIEGTSILLEKSASNGAMAVSLPSVGTINLDVLQCSGTVTLGIYKNDAGTEDNLIETITVAGTPWPVNTGDITFNLKTASKVIVKNLSGGQVSVDNFRWIPNTNTAINSVDVADLKVVSEQFYTVTGAVASPSATGLLIRKVIYEDGSMQSFKVLKQIK